MVETALPLYRTRNDGLTAGKIHIGVPGMESMLCGLQATNGTFEEHYRETGSRTENNTCPQCNHTLKVLNWLWDTEQREEHFQIAGPADQERTGAGGWFEGPADPDFIPAAYVGTIGTGILTNETLTPIRLGLDRDAPPRYESNSTCEDCLYVGQIGVWDVYKHDAYYTGDADHITGRRADGMSINLIPAADRITDQPIWLTLDWLERHSDGD